MKPILWDTIQCNPFKNNRRFGRTYCLNIHDRRLKDGDDDLLDSCFIRLSALKMEANFLRNVEIFC
jgi:hypothetical protein